MKNYIILTKSFEHYLRPATGTLLLFGLLMGFSLLTFWDESSESVFLLGSINLFDVTLSSIRSEAFNALFYDLYSTFWLFLLLTYIPNRIIYPLSNSFSVNQSLWIRMLPHTTNFDFALSKIFYLIYSLTILFLASLAWVIMFASLKGLRIQDLLTPVIGLMGHVIIAAGMIFIVCYNKKMAAATRKSWVFLTLFLPILLYLIGDVSARKLNGFFPYAAPFAVKYNGHIVLKPFLTNLLVGVFLLSVFLMKNFYSTAKNERL